ncbi:MAG: hypothetical protein QM689_05690 [Oscillospiraceae bacterium]
MTTEQFFVTLGSIDEDLLAEADNAVLKRSFLRTHRRGLRVLAACAAVMIVLTAVYAPSFINTGGLGLARYTSSIPENKVEFCWMSFSDQEIIADKTDTYIRGEILKVRTVHILFSKSGLSYYSVADVRAETVYGGTVKAGETVSILFPTLMQDVDVPKTSLQPDISLYEGMHGIFLLRTNGDSNRIKTYLGDIPVRSIAQFSVLTPHQFMAVELPDGLWGYDTLCRNADGSPATLDEAEKYLKELLQKYRPAQ